MRTTRRWRALLVAVIVLPSVKCGAPAFGDRTTRAQELVWLDAEGRVTGVVPRSAATYAGLWLAPDERTAVTFLEEPDVPWPDRRPWRIDLLTGEAAPIDLPVGDHRPSGRLTHWSDRLRVFDGSAPGAGDVWVAGNPPAPYRVTPWMERSGQVSPEGQWMAYVSEEGGRPEIYIQTFHDPSRGRWLASGVDGGEWPVWRSDSLRLYYWAPGARLMAVPLKRGQVLVEPGRPIAMFQAPASTPMPYAVTLDDRVLMALSRSRPTPP